MKKIGCIGIGNMGGAVCSAICRKYPEETVLVCDMDSAKTADFREKYGCESVDSRTLAAQADYIFLGIKPQYMTDVLTEIRDVLAARLDAGERPVIVTMAAGLTMQWFRDVLALEMPVIRIMPNIPVSVGQGMIMYTCTEDVTEADKAEFLDRMALAGILDALPENLIDAGTAVSGCGPAFLCLILEAMADGGVACGLPRQKAMQYAAQTLLGTASVLLETGKHPGVFKDEVTSPGGSTIAGVKAMEDAGVRAGMMEAVMAAYRKNLELGKK
ncbi:MAG: pyrroline-5-carboxylate reductase [Ruminococcaceae bacterium]|nr:pyrroline-5-carboxylate reductase [Oscillospiraceae bacterium]